jgi:hypothetical protein
MTRPRFLVGRNPYPAPYGSRISQRPPRIAQNRPERSEQHRTPTDSRRCRHDHSGGEKMTLATAEATPTERLDR